MYPMYPPYPNAQQGSTPPQPPAVVAPRDANRGGGGADTGNLDTSILGVLRNMEREDLQRLDERAIDCLLSDDKELRELSDQKVTEQASNRSLAEHSLTFQSRFEQGRRSLVAVHKETFELSRQHRDLRDRLQGGGGGRRGADASSLENLHTLMQSACLEAEESADALLDSLLAGRLNLAEFLTRYTEARTLCHLRRAKAEKLTEISNQRIVQSAAGFRTTESPVAPVQYQQQMHQQLPPQYQQMPPMPPPPMPSYYYPSPPNYQQPPPLPQPRPPYGRP